MMRLQELSAHQSLPRLSYRNTTSTPPLRYDLHPASALSSGVMKGLQHTTAFVIQFRCTAEDDLKQFPGRVEHVASGRTATFESIEELPQLLLTLLKCECPSPSQW